MPLSPADTDFLKELYANTDPNKPLEPGSPFYQPIYEGPGIEDPIAILQTKIEFAGAEGVFLLSGFRGSGKTTELFRLKQRLERAGHLVLYADALRYVHPAQPLDIAHLLMAIGGALSDAIDGLGGFGAAPLDESYWNRLWNFLVKTDIEFKEFNALGLKLVMRDNDSFRQRVSRALSGHISELEREVKSFAELCGKRIRKKRPATGKIVFLFDQLEQVRGSLSEAGEVLASVERVFAQNLHRLQLPYLHVIYTVPPWLKFVLPGTPVDVLHCVRQWNNDAQRSAHAPGNQNLLAAIQRRFGSVERMGRFWKDVTQPERLVQVCGGHFKDLLKLVQETIARVGASGRLPAGDDTVASAILAVRTSFLPVALDDALWLAEVSETRRCALRSPSHENVGRLTRLIDTHLVLYLRNGEEWYDVHPLVLPDVLEIAAAGRQRDQPQ